MLPGGVTIVSFTSESSAGIINIGLGFIPDAVIMIQDAEGAAPNLRFWVNNDHISAFDVARTILLTGTTGVTSQDTSGITKFAGGHTIDTTDPYFDGVARDPVNYRKRDGSQPAQGYVMQEGLTIPADNQTNSGLNILICFRSDE